MTDLIRSHAHYAPAALALRTPEEQWSYADLDAAVDTAAAQLEDIGIDQGDRVGVHLSRGADAIVLLWALWRRGGVAVPLSTRLPADEVVAQAHRVDCRLLVTTTTAVAESSGPALSVRGPSEVIEGTSRRPGEDRARSRERPATIVFTSGTTGAPKAALHTWANHWYSAKGSNANIPLRRGDRWVLSLPLYHVGGLAILVRCALAGAAVVVPDPEGPLADTIAAHSVTHVSLVATQFRRLLKAVADPPSTMRAVLLGGGPLPRPLLRRGVDRGWPLHTSYGCTEMASQVTTTAPGAPWGTLQTAGRCLPHRRLRIEDGEIMVAGPTLFRGYVTENGVVDPRTEQGWYPTGDRGRLDASGRLRVIGRIDRMFVSGGENIQPEEIEDALERLDGVKRAIVVPVNDDEYGQRPVAFVTATHDTVTPHRLRDQLARVLPGFKIPDAFHSLPSEAGSRGRSVDRALLRRRARELQDELGD